MLRGYVKVSVLSGSIKINGFIIESDETSNENEYHSLYSSPYGNDACLIIKHHSNPCQIHLQPMKRMQVNSTKQNFDPIFRINGCYFIYDASILLRKKFSKSLKLSSGSEICRRQRIMFNECPPLFIPPSWSRCLDYIEKDIVDNNTSKASIMVCARIQTGKSTFTRYGVNRLLNFFDRVAYLDTDVGQSEFTPHGTCLFVGFFLLLCVYPCTK